MPHRRRRRGRKSKFVTKRGLPFQLMKYAETKFNDLGVVDVAVPSTAVIGGLFQSLTLTETGVGQKQRIGNMIQVTGISGLELHSLVLETKKILLHLFLIWLLQLIQTLTRSGLIRLSTVLSRPEVEMGFLKCVRGSSHT